MSSPPVFLSGQYTITNVGYGRPVGHPPTLPAIQPIVTVSKPQIWEVKHIKNHLYVLTISGFAAVAKDNHVWSYLEPPEVQEWVITQRASGINEYTILSTVDGGKGWTLHDKDETQVSLEIVPATHSIPPQMDPKQLWSFRLAIQPQHPKFLWIGCSDARVSESVMNLALDQIFVQRNIANQFPTDDDNARSVLTYGVKYIANDPVQEVRVVGHTGCGGVSACLAAVQPDPTPLPDDPYLRRWLEPLVALARQDPDQSLLELTERNVEAQVLNVRSVLHHLHLNRRVEVKGFVYHIAERELREIFAGPI